MTSHTPSIIDILKDPATYKKAWVGTVVPIAVALVGLYLPDSHLSINEVLTAIVGSLSTGAAVFGAKNKPAS